MLKTGFHTAVPKKAAVLAIFSGKKAKLGNKAAELDKKTGGAIAAAIKAAKSFDGKCCQSLVLSGIKNSGADQIIVLGTEAKDKEKLCPMKIEESGATLVKALKAAKLEEAAVLTDAPDGIDVAEFAAHLAYGAVLQDYTFGIYKKKKDAPKKLKALDIVLANAAEAKKLFAPLEKIAAGVFLTRDLVSEPPNVLYPESFAARAKKELTPLGIKVQILTDKQMEKMGMGALMSVGKGSARPPRMVIMQYDGAPKSASAAAKKPVAFVGKGITFDTGGISLKPGPGMEDMKWDMAGAGVVTGLMKALAGRKAKLNAVGIIALAENMPSDRASRPSDVVTSLSGQTVEILNTDAEGRLVLADALWHVQEKFKPKTVIDLATLTGAIIIALGNEYAGVFSNDEELSARLVETGAELKEKTWHMPMCKAWDKAIDSDIADMKNIGGDRGAGSATAAAFLARFIKDGTSWAHLDIAGMAWSKKERLTVPKGATAFGVRLLDRLVAKHYESK
jgi:leucyl aminopeptidase